MRIIKAFNKNQWIIGIGSSLLGAIIFALIWNQIICIFSSTWSGLSHQIEVPFWFLIFLPIAFLGLVILIRLIIKKTNAEQIQNHHVTVSTQNTYLERIGFSIEDTPILTCWKITGQTDPNEPVLIKGIDGFKGDFLSISLKQGLPIDNDVKPISRNAKTVEWVVDPQNDFVPYLHINVISADDSKIKNCWLNHDISNLIIKPFGDGKEDWYFPIASVDREGKWLRYQINIVLS